jgi:hypothetical protein
MLRIVRIAFGASLLTFCAEPAVAKWQWVPTSPTDCGDYDAMTTPGEAQPQPELCSEDYKKFYGKVVICWSAGHPNAPMCAYKDRSRAQCVGGGSIGDAWVCENK